MPTIKTVSVTYGRKLNMGNYQSADLSVTIWADIDLDELGRETEEQARVLDHSMRELWEAARNNVRAEALRLQGKADESEKIWRGLPEDEVINEVFSVHPPVIIDSAIADDLEAGLDPSDGMPFGDK